MQIPLDIALTQVVGFMLIVARLSGMFLIAPVFSSKMIPVRIKVMALLVLAATMTPIVMGQQPDVPTDVLGLLISMLLESVVGLAIGFSVAIVFTAVQVGASLIDTSIGFSMANIIDPVNNVQASVLGSFYSLVATLAFLSVNGHHWMLVGFTRSFDIVPVGGVPDVEQMSSNLFAAFSGLFMMAFQIAAPVLVTLLLVDVVLGIVARVVPQMNVFFVGIPLKISVGLVAVIITLPTFTGFLERRVNDVVAGVGVVAAKVEQPGEVTAANG
ncbi:MAG: flagellar type III secretion system protein FliR [Thermoleophilia bacterium]|nr:flagellar type III secretion system protein FliR [Thermoleophilia bacterium]